MREGGEAGGGGERLSGLKITADRSTVKMVNLILALSKTVIDRSLIRTVEQIIRICLDTSLFDICFAF